MMFKAAVLLALVACASCFFVFPDIFTGTYVQVNVNDQAVIATANLGVGYLSNMWYGHYHYRMARIIGAWSQVATGLTYYKFDVVLGLTTCLKSQYAFNLLGNCAFQTGWGTYQRCQIVLNVGSNGNLGSVNSWACVTIPNNQVFGAMSSSEFRTPSEGNLVAQMH